MPLNPDTLKRLREKRGLTQEQAADAAGIAQGRWSEYEAGKRQIMAYDVVCRVAKALGVKPADLMSGA